MCILLLPAPPLPQDIQLLAKKDDSAALGPQPHARTEAVVWQESCAVFATGHLTVGAWLHTYITCLVSVGL